MKKHLEARIRGWLPKEKTLPKTSTQTCFPPTQLQHLRVKPTPTHLEPGTLRATKVLGFETVVWTLLSLLFLAQTNDQYYRPITFQIPWITTGLIAGFVVSTIHTQREIEYFERKDRFPTPDATELIRLLALITGAVIAVIVVEYVLISNLPGAVPAFFSFLFAISPTAFGARLLLFVRFEKKKDIYIIQYWLKSGIFALPKKAPYQDTQTFQKIVAKQENGVMS